MLYSIESDRLISRIGTDTGTKTPARKGVFLGRLRNLDGTDSGRDVYGLLVHIDLLIWPSSPICEKC